jgi:hypothetical protein
MIAGLLAGDAMALFAELRDIPVSGDGLAWFNGCETLDRAALAELVARGGRAGMTVLLTTASEAAAVRLAGSVNVLAIHQLADPEAAGQLAVLTGGGAVFTGGGAVITGAGAGLAGAGAGAGGPGSAAAPPGAAVPLVPAAAHDAGAPAAASAVPDWARRMPAPTAAGSSAGPGSAASVPGPAANHPFSRKGGPAVTADSLLGLGEGAFTLVVRGAEQRILPRCQAVPARIPGRPA